MINITCQSCGHRFQVEESHAGRFTRCPTCSSQVPVPALGPGNNRGFPTPGTPGTPGIPGSPGSPSASSSIRSQYYHSYGSPTGPTVTSGLAIAALILGIFSFCIPLLALVALGLGIAALVQISRPGSQRGGRGVAIAGVSLSGVALLLQCLMVWGFFSMAGRAGASGGIFDEVNLVGFDDALHAYRDTHDGQFPDHPRQLIDAGLLQSQDFQRISSLLREQPLEPSSPPPEPLILYGDYYFVYHGLDGVDTPPEAVLAFSKKDGASQRRVLFASGRIEAMTPEQFDDLLRRQNQRRVALWSVPPIPDPDTGIVPPNPGPAADDEPAPADATAE